MTCQPRSKMRTSGLAIYADGLIRRAKSGTVLPDPVKRALYILGYLVPTNTIALDVAVALINQSVERRKDDETSIR